MGCWVYVDILGALYVVLTFGQFHSMAWRLINLFIIFSFMNDKGYVELITDVAKWSIPSGIIARLLAYFFKFPEEVALDLSMLLFFVVNVLIYVGVNFYQKWRKGK